MSATKRYPVVIALEMPVGRVLLSAQQTRLDAQRLRYRGSKEIYLTTYRGPAGMFSSFVYQTIPLKNISLDISNPRIVTQNPLTTEAEIVSYLFQHEELAPFIRKIVREGKNLGAERPFVVKDGNGYIVVEGNTRIAAYKLLTGVLAAPPEIAPLLPTISEEMKASFLDVDCSIAPTRDALLPIMANSHFGTGDKSKWGYLGSRKALYDLWEKGRTPVDIALAFDRTESEIRQFILEYQLYRHALAAEWTSEQEHKLTEPGVEFNPPVRFLQTTGHKTKLGVTYDTVMLKVNFADAEAKRKFRHLIKKLVIERTAGVTATANWDQVFGDYVPAKAPAEPTPAKPGEPQAGPSGGPSEPPAQAPDDVIDRHLAKPGAGDPKDPPEPRPKPGILFTYPVKVTSGLLTQMMKEAKSLNCNTFPAAGTFLLRSMVETLLKHLIDEAKANPNGETLSLEKCLSYCMGNVVNLPADDRKVLKEFQKNHLDYLNLGAHGNVVPNPTRLFSARDAIEQFIKRYI